MIPHHVRYFLEFLASIALEGQAFGITQRKGNRVDLGHQ